MVPTVFGVASVGAVTLTWGLARALAPLRRLAPAQIDEACAVALVGALLGSHTLSVAARPAPQWDELARFDAGYTVEGALLGGVLSLMLLGGSRLAVAPAASATSRLAVFDVMSTAALVAFTLPTVAFAVERYGAAPAATLLDGAALLLAALIAALAFRTERLGEPAFDGAATLAAWFVVRTPWADSDHTFGPALSAAHAVAIGAVTLVSAVAASRASPLAEPRARVRLLVLALVLAVAAVRAATVSSGTVLLPAAWWLGAVVFPLLALVAPALKAAPLIDVEAPAEPASNVADTDPSVRAVDGD